MDNSRFEAIVAKDKYLNLLINEHKFGVMANIKKTPEMDAEFVDWVSPKYLEAFKTVYKKHAAENPAIIGTVLRMKFLEH